MAATDYVIATGWMNAYLTRKKKPTKNGPQTMSNDRRLCGSLTATSMATFVTRCCSLMLVITIRLLTAH